MVHQDGARVHAGQGSIAAEHYAAQVLVITHTAKHDVGSLCRLAWGRRTGMGAQSAGVTGKLLHPTLRLGWCAVVDSDLVTGQCQVARHGVAHHAQP